MSHSDSLGLKLQVEKKPECQVSCLCVCSVDNRVIKAISFVILGARDIPDCVLGLNLGLNKSVSFSNKSSQTL